VICASIAYQLRLLLRLQSILVRFRPYLKQVDAFAAGDAKATLKVRLMLKGMIGPI
jgi:hypothetical protein